MAKDGSIRMSVLELVKDEFRRRTTRDGADFGRALQLLAPFPSRRPELAFIPPPDWACTEDFWVHPSGALVQQRPGGWWAAYQPGANFAFIQHLCPEHAFEDARTGFSVAPSDASVTPFGGGPGWGAYARGQYLGRYQSEAIAKDRVRMELLAEPVA